MYVLNQCERDNLLFYNEYAGVTLRSIRHEPRLMTAITVTFECPERHRIDVWYHFTAGKGQYKKLDATEFCVECPTCKRDYQFLGNQRIDPDSE
jgi:hypothetical protein